MYCGVLCFSEYDGLMDLLAISPFDIHGYETHLDAK